MKKNPLMSIAGNHMPGATLRDLFACVLYDTAVELVANMQPQQRDELAAACGIPPNRDGSYQYDYTLMFGFFSYQLAEGMIKIRAFFEQEPEPQNSLELE